MGYDWDWSIFLPYANALIRGVGVTLALAISSSIAGTALGIFGAVILKDNRTAKFWLFLNDIGRSIPLLVLIFFFYYFPMKQLLNISALSPFLASFFAISISQAFFTLDLTYSTFGQVNQEVVDSARALGLKEAKIMTYYYIPAVIRLTLPAQMAFWIGNLKLTSLASVVGCQEIVFVASVIGSQQFRTLEPWVLTGIVYAILVLPLSYLMKRIESSAWIKRR